MFVPPIQKLGGRVPPPPTPQDRRSCYTLTINVHNYTEIEPPVAGRVAWYRTSPNINLIGGGLNSYCLALNKRTLVKQLQRKV